MERVFSRQEASWRSVAGEAAAVVLVVAVLRVIGSANYPLFHSIANMISVVIAGSMFVIAWNTRKIASNNYLLTLGIAQLFVGAMLLLHGLAFPGTAVFGDVGGNLTAQLWVISRFLEVTAFLLAALTLWRRVPVAVTVLVPTVIAALSLGALWVVPVFPVMYVQGAGITAAKAMLTYPMIALFLLNALLLWMKRAAFEQRMLVRLVAALVLMALAELAFTAYVEAGGGVNFVGHIVALGAYALLYVALIQGTLQEPYETLFRALQRREESERRIADTLQAALITVPARISGLETGVAYVSATESARVGGDFWDIFLPQPGKIAFVLGDVCGKGIEAAVTTALVRSTLRGFAYDDPDPATVLRRTNVAVTPQLADDKFVTVLYGVADAKTGLTRIATAGHPFPIIMDGGPPQVLVVPISPPLGVCKETEFQVAETPWDAVGTVVLFSDGVTESGWRHEQFGLDRVLEHVAEHKAEDPTALASSLLEAAVRHAEGKISDDVAVVVLRRTRWTL